MTEKASGRNYLLIADEQPKVSENQFVVAGVDLRRLTPRTWSAASNRRMTTITFGFAFADGQSQLSVLRFCPEDLLGLANLLP